MPAQFSPFPMMFLPQAAQDSKAIANVDTTSLSTVRNVAAVSSGAAWEDHIPPDVVGLARLDDCLLAVKHDPVFYHCFPKKDATAGVALKHCLTQVSNIVRRQYPCVYKIGFTHCLKWRWSNKLYGYVHDKDKYQHMVAVFISAAAIGASLMEAILIKEHFGILNETCRSDSLFFGVFGFDHILPDRGLRS